MNPSLLLSHSFIIFFLLFTPTVSSFSTQTISYSHHCNFFAPEAIPTEEAAFARYPYLEPITSHYTGGEDLLGLDFPSHRSILLNPTPNLFKTNIIDTYNIQARLLFSSSNIYHCPSNFTLQGGRSKYTQVDWLEHHGLMFLLDGFWSVSTNKLCMVGSGNWFPKDGNPLKLSVVLKLNFAKYMNSNTSLVSGSLKSLASPDDSNYFEPISMLGFPRVVSFKYKYTLVCNEECNGGFTQHASATILQSIDMCSSFSSRFSTYQLEYPSSSHSKQNCTPFGQGTGYLPSFVSLYVIQCSSQEQKLRLLVEFQDRRNIPHYRSFNPNITLIGEGTWNGTEDELCIFACQILNQSDPLGCAHIGDCSIRLTLWYPAVRTIKNTHTTEGQIWTTKRADETGYFETIKFQSFGHSMDNYASEYEFTQMEKMSKFCPTTKNAKREGGIHTPEHYYPDEYYYHDEHHHQGMFFDISVRHKDMASTGSAAPIFVGNRFCNSHITEASNFKASSPTAAGSTTSYRGPLSISYEISFGLNISSISTSGISSLNLSSTRNGKVEISAEGVYDDETGQLCMVGCRKLHSYGKNLRNASYDCDILVTFQLLQTNGDGERYIKGSIESLRQKTDVLYFEHLDVFSLAYTITGARNSIWRMDLEIIIVLISDTLACLFIGKQLFHVKKRPEMVPFISVLLMLILAFGTHGSSGAKL